MAHPTKFNMSSAKTLLRILASFENWPIVLLDSLGLSLGKEIVFEFKGGPSFLLPSNKNMIGLINEIVFDRVYDGFFTRLSDNAVVLDVGAGMGIFSVMAALRLPKAEVYSFEPSPYNYCYLVKNVVEAGLKDRVHPFRYAVAANQGTRDLALSDDLVGNTLYPGRHDGKPTVLVETLSLDHILAWKGLERVDLLKMDCEGAELEILESVGSETFSRVTNLTMELGEGNSERVDQILRGHGYQVDFSVADPGRRLLYCCAGKS